MSTPSDTAHQPGKVSPAPVSPMSKPQVRALMLATRKLWNRVDRTRDVEKLYKRFTATKLWEKSWCIAITMSTSMEIDTTPLITLAAEQGRIIVIPRITGLRDMNFYPLAFGTRLEKNRLGISEPVGEKAVDPSDIDLMIVPGLAFSKAGDRLGYGGGFYDKWIAANPKVPTLSFAYRWQVSEKPLWKVDSWDQKIDHLLVG